MIVLFILFSPDNWSGVIPSVSLKSLPIPSSFFAKSLILAKYLSTALNSDKSATVPKKASLGLFISPKSSLSYFFKFLVCSNSLVFNLYSPALPINWLFFLNGLNLLKNDSTAKLACSSVTLIPSKTISSPDLVKPYSVMSLLFSPAILLNSFIVLSLSALNPLTPSSIASLVGL